MSTRRLYVDGASGTMFVGTANINVAGAISDPVGNRQNLFFHSNLPYIQIRQKFNTGSLTFAAQDRGIFTWEDGSKGCGGCCFIMLEARYGTGVLDAVVRRYRNEHITEKNKRGYYKLAEVVVPLMRKHKLVKFLVITTFATPAVCYAKWYYGYNSWGWVFTPLKKFWMSIFNTLGGETKFVRENGEIV
jgi:hypothetical protein